MRIGKSLVLFSLLLAVASPATAQRRQQRLVIGFGLGRVIPLNPITPGEEYKLNDAGATIITVDYWFVPAVAARLSYESTRGRLAVPEQDSFAKIWTSYLGVLLAPVSVGARPRPYLVLGGGVRHYDVNAAVEPPGGGPTWDISPTQYRLAGYAGAGGTVTIKRVSLVPEVGFFVNDLRHNFPCNGCSGQVSRQVDLQVSVNLQLR